MLAQNYGVLTAKLTAKKRWEPVEYGIVRTNLERPLGKYLENKKRNTARNQYGALATTSGDVHDGVDVQSIAVLKCRTDQLGRCYD